MCNYLLTPFCQGKFGKHCECHADDIALYNKIMPFSDLTRKVQFNYMLYRVLFYLNVTRFQSDAAEFGPFSLLEMVFVYPPCYAILSELPR